MHRMTRGLDRPTPSVLTLLVVAVVACANPTVQSFDVEPRRVCQGDSVEIRWQATGEARLTTEPNLPVVGTVVARGTLQARPEERTLFRLSMLEGQDYAEQTVQVYADSEQDTLSGSTSPVGDSAVVAHFEVPADKYADLLRIDRAVNLTGRPLSIQHESRTAVLPADTAPSDLLDSWTPGGGWTLQGPLVSGEVMGDPNRPPPRHLRLRVRLTCQR